MAKIFQLTNSTSTLAAISTEVIGVAFINRGEFAFLNERTLDYNSLTIEEKAIVDPFLDLMKTKVLTDGTAGTDGAQGVDQAEGVDVPVR